MQYVSLALMGCLYRYSEATVCNLFSGRVHKPESLFHLKGRYIHCEVRWTLREALGQ